MQLIHEPHEVQPGRKRVCVGIGFFDGVHLGHQQVIRQTIADARRHDACAMAVTFDRHPNTVVSPDRVPQLIQSNGQKLSALRELGVDVTWLISFDREFSNQTGEAFVRRLAAEFGRLLSVCVGSEFAFGHKRSGDVALLRKLGEALGFEVHGLAAVALDGQVVSSTRIRESIRAGDFDAAGQMLGRPYALAGVISPGDQLGRKLGFPTANLEVTGRVLPPNGVYAAQVKLQGRAQRAVVNIGVRPSVSGSGERRVEAHVLDFEGDLYGQELELIFSRRLRDEQKFRTIGELAAAIRSDIEAARREGGESGKNP
jgi:riboflavin kinase / FMN adenylyltransferase